MDDWIIFDITEGRDFQWEGQASKVPWVNSIVDRPQTMNHEKSTIPMKIHVNGSGWDALVSEAFEEPKGK